MKRNSKEQKGRATMRLGTLRISATVAALGIAVALTGCGSSGDGSDKLGGPSGSENPGGGGPGGGNPGGGGPGGGENPGPGGNQGTPDPNKDPNLVNRQVNYGEALRIASLKLVGELPTLADIKKVATNDAAGETAYKAIIDTYLADPRFTQQVITWWRNTLKTGQQGAPAQGRPNLDTAALFAASVTVGDRPYTDILTATSGTCPTFANNTFTPANCAGGQPVSGVLSDPGIMSQYFGNMAFRRVRFVQETFACSKFPAEYSKTPTPMGASVYTSPWKFDSITGGATARVNFQDTSAVICANCHTTMNHIAPLFANFNANGQYNATTIQVQTPVTPPVTTTMADWLPAGEKLAWRTGVEITDIPSLGQAMAKDPEIPRCAVNRVWNWAFSRGDIVDDLATVPPSVTEKLVTDFSANGMKMKTLIRAVFTSEDFVKF
jgi:hypothetical protein